jgi:ABC-2 type transport system permease protein
MTNLWLVAKHEYRRMVMRRGFVILTVAIPLGLTTLIALAIFVEKSSESSLPVGYVDQAGLLDVSRQSAVPDAEKHVQVVAYPDTEAATAALERKEIQAFWVLPPDFLQTLHTELYYLENPPGDAWGEFDDFVRANLVAGLPADVQQRLLEGPTLTVHDTSSGREFSENSIVNVILPFVTTFFFYFATMSAAGYMLGAVAEEKENRTMEVMLTSLTPGQLIGGKAVGLMAASLSQLAVYVVTAVVAIKIATPYVAELQGVTVPWAYLGLMALFFFPAYGLISSILLAIGSTVTEVQQGQQIGGLLNLFFMLPILLLPVLFQDPGHPLMVAFTLFPTTSFLTISLRWGFGSIPAWQLVVSWFLLTATTLFMVWAAARIFRAGMLRYGQPLTLKGMIAAVRG